MNADCILLAAGGGTRFGANKLLHEIDGEPMAFHAIRLHASIPYAHRVLVIREAYGQIAAFAERNGFDIVINRAPARGVGSSVSTGVARLCALAGGEAPVLFGVCDQPYLTDASVRGLLGEALARPGRIVRLCSQTRAGNPVVFPALLLPELARLNADAGGGAVMRAHPELVYEARIASECELKDVDYPEDAKGVRTP